jgi:hypothetical protein
MSPKRQESCVPSFFREPKAGLRWLVGVQLSLKNQTTGAWLVLSCFESVLDADRLRFQLLN